MTNGKEKGRSEKWGQSRLSPFFFRICANGFGRTHSCIIKPMKLAIATLIVAATTVSAFSQSLQKAAEDKAEVKVVAAVAGTTITDEQLEEAASEQLDLLPTERLAFEAGQRRKRHQILENQLHKMVEEELLKRESEARGLSKEELLELEVSSQVKEPTPEEVDEFYEANKARIRSPKEQMADRIIQHLNQMKNQQVYQSFLNRLGQKYEASYLLEPFYEKIETQGHPSAGPVNAPVTIVEFSDFQCPFCSNVVPTLEKVKENYEDQVRLVFRQFPLNSIHPQAQKAAEASLCAAEQDKFWEMHDLMFEDKKLSLPDLKSKAESLGLDTIAFEQCLNSDQFAERVRQDISAGARAGVTGTPTLFINGRPMTGAVSYEQITTIIEEELQSSN